MKMVLQVMALGLIGAVGAAQEHMITESKLPSAVKASAERESQGAKVVGYSTEMENGKKLYEVELMKDGKTKDVTMDADGKVVEVEEQVELTELSPAVRDAIQAKAGKGTIKKVESLKKQDKLVAYEAQVVRGGKRGEVQVGPNGEALSHPE